MHDYVVIKVPLAEYEQENQSVDQEHEGAADAGNEPRSDQSSEQHLGRQPYCCGQSDSNERPSGGVPSVSERHRWVFEHPVGHRNTTKNFRPKKPNPASPPPEPNPPPIP